MCSRYADTVAPDALRAFFRVVGGQAPGGVVAPTDGARVIRRHPDTGRWQADTLRWGVVPAWAPDPSVGVRAFNARAETLAVKPTFKDALVRRRALVPAAAYYEWGDDGRGGRQAHTLTAADGAPLAFAGLWEGWRDRASGDWLRTFTLITTAANPDVRPLHDRMPVILAPGDWARWLEPGDGDDPAALLRPCRAGTLAITAAPPPPPPSAPLSKPRSPGRGGGARQIGFDL